MKMYVPSIGDYVKLTKDWEFPCFAEHRNVEFIRTARPDTELKDNRWGFYDDTNQSFAITLPVGTILRVDRIYIRKGKGEWDSITFVVAKHPTLPSTGFSGAGRFWAKLIDVNEIEFEPCDKPIPAKKSRSKTKP
jgi:hypothetical protein